MTNENTYNTRGVRQCDEKWILRYTHVELLVIGAHVYKYYLHYHQNLVLERPTSSCADEGKYRGSALTESK